MNCIPILYFMLVTKALYNERCLDSEKAFDL